jgi:hypothetical protein
MNTKGRSSSRASRLASLSLLGLGAALAASGCLTRPLEPLDTRTTWTTHFAQAQSGISKIDLLLMIDNSGSMADKQAMLADAVPKLVRGLLNPPCVGTDNQPVAEQPASPADLCPAGSAREFEPVFDVHIGIVSSSIGGHGVNVCVRKESDKTTWQLNDGGHLVARLDADQPDVQAPTYEGTGFLAWDPEAKLTPPGETTLDGVESKLRDLVKGTGQAGCGYEASLESWYRFLIDPEPYETIALNDKSYVVTSGIDQRVLDERAAFLRPDSMVAILMLTDENDCSIREDQYFPIVGIRESPMFRARAICETNPNDRCCAPCEYTPADCPADPTCDVPRLTPQEDPENLRCWNQKKRFGWDFLYPTDRYVKALTSAKIARKDGQLVDNPLYPPDPDGKLHARVPEQGLVFLAGIVGVPWQDIARQREDGTPDLLHGLDGEGNPVGGFMSAGELAQRDKDTKTSRWDVILGDPASNVAPLDPLMRESREPREGQNPITGDALRGPESTSPNANPINGHEWNTFSQSIGDLQYACVFDLKESDVKVCSGTVGGCDCTYSPDDGGQNPLCQDANGQYSHTQRRAKGYPGLRQLDVLKGLGEQGIVGSVCPVQVTDPSSKDYGYSPAIGALVERLKRKLTGQCLTRPVTAADDGSVACVVIEATQSNGEACCQGKARRPVSADHQQAALEAKSAAKGADCFCEIDQLRGDDRAVCQNDVSVVPVGADGEPVDGWCYVDQQTGNPALVQNCSAGEKYKLRFIGGGQPAKEAATFITCAGGG